MQLSKTIDLSNVLLSTAASIAVEVDTKECDGVFFVGIPATTAARTWSIALKVGATTTGFVTCASTHTLTSSAAANHVIVSDVYRPGKRYVGATLSCTAATPAYLLAFKYANRKVPITFSATANLPAAKCISAVSPSSAT